MVVRSEMMTANTDSCKYGSEFHRVKLKTESNRKLSNFNFQWTKTLYQNNLKNIAFFFAFFKG